MENEANKSNKNNTSSTKENQISILQSLKKSVTKYLRIRRKDFIEFNFDWFLYYFLLLAFYIALHIIEIPTTDEREILYIIIYLFSAFIASSLMCYFPLKKAKKTVFKEDSSKRTFLWHTSGILLGVLIFIYMREDAAFENSYFPSYFVFSSIITGYYFSAISLYSFKIIIEDITKIDFTDNLRKIKEYTEDFDRSNTRICYYIGKSLRKSYNIIIRISLATIAVITGLFLFVFTTGVVIFIFAVILLIMGYRQAENEVSSFWDNSSEILYMFLYILLVIGIGYVSYHCIKRLFLYAMINFSQGVKGEYRPIISKETSEYKLDVMKKGIRNIDFWHPTIELSYSIIAIFYIASSMLELSSVFLFPLSFVIGTSILITIWIFEDANLVYQDQNTSFILDDDFRNILSLTKMFRTTKKSIQITALIPILLWLESTTITEMSTKSILQDVVIISFFYRLFLGGISLIMFVGIVGAFSWYFLYFIRNRYPKIVDEFHEGVLRKTTILSGDDKGSRPKKRKSAT